MLITTTIAYTYDPLYRLTSARYSDGRFLEYRYDSAGKHLGTVRSMTRQPGAS